MKKENIICKALSRKIKLDGKFISHIYFDLFHINLGWDKHNRDYKQGKARSNFTKEDVVNFFEQLEYLKQEPRPQKIILATVEKRYVFYVYHQSKNYTMVVDLMKNGVTVVVTLYQNLKS